MSIFSVGTAISPEVKSGIPSADRIKFGLLASLTSHNIGDEIQVIAARRFLPRVDLVLDRDLPADTIAESKTPVVVIANGWFSHRPEGWPPPSSVIPLLISMHLSLEIWEGIGKLDIDVPSAFISQSSVDYLKQFGPVGGRDIHTTTLLLSAGIDAYMSGCLTLTLDRDQTVERDEYIVCFDLPNKVIESIHKKTRRPLVLLTHNYYNGNHAERMARAEKLLDLYQRAYCVVTTRLHCALPCLALQTPTLLIDTASDQYRFSGLHELLHHCTPEAFIDSQSLFDLDTPPANNLDYLKFRNALIDQVQEFIGCVVGAGFHAKYNEITLLRMRHNTIWAQCAELADKCKRLSKELSRVQNNSDEVTKKLVASHQAIDKLNDNLSRATNELMQTKEHISKLLTSISWRVTRPLRAIRSILSRQRN